MAHGPADRAARSRPENRTGPIGRLARAAWAVAVALTLGSIVDSRGPTRFRNPHILTEPSAWLLHLLVLTAFVVLVGAVGEALGGRGTARRAQGVALAVIAAAVGLAALIGQLAGGSAWGFPLADAVWIFDVLMLVEELAAFVLAISLGTPGCEIGVWPELIARARGTRWARTDGLSCVVGLQLIDRWEGNRRRDRAPIDRVRGDSD
jgi:hypothetical protein